MTNDQTERLADLRDKADKTPEETATFDALVALADRTEELETAKEADPKSAETVAAKEAVVAAEEAVVAAEEAPTVT